MRTPPKTMVNNNKHSPVQNIKRVEAAYWRRKLYANRVWKEQVIPVWDKCSKAKVVWCKPTHKYQGCQGMYWKYTFSNTRGRRRWGFEWRNNGRGAKRLKLGNSFYSACARHNSLAQMASALRETLVSLVDDYLCARFSPRGEDTVGRVELVINGRLYGFACTLRNTAAVWTVCAWPHDRVERVTL